MNRDELKKGLGNWLCELLGLTHSGSYKKYGELKDKRIVQMIRLAHEAVDNGTAIYTAPFVAKTDDSVVIYELNIILSKKELPDKKDKIEA